MNLTNSDYTIDRYWADTFMPAIEEVIRKVANKIIEFTIAPEQEDNEQATDYLITVETGTIACRVRRDYPKQDFTIRTWREGRQQTEIHKLKAGYAKWYVYAWASNEKTIERAILVDLDKLRKSKVLEKIDLSFWEIPYTRYKKINGIDHIRNKDNKTGFVGIPLSMLDTFGCILEEIRN